MDGVRAACSVTRPPSDLFGYRRYRNDDARLDALIEDMVLREAGVIEGDQPTEYSHYVAMAQFEQEATGEFTPSERMEIRAALGLDPFGRAAP